MLPKLMHDSQCEKPIILTRTSTRAPKQSEGHPTLSCRQSTFEVINKGSFVETNDLSERDPQKTWFHFAPRVTQVHAESGR